MFWNLILTKKSKIYTMVLIALGLLAMSWGQEPSSLSSPVLPTQSAGLDSGSYQKSQPAGRPIDLRIFRIDGQGMSGAYLNEVKAPPKDANTLQAQLFSPSITHELNDRNSYNIQHEDRDNYHLNDMQDQQNWVSQNQNNASWAVHSIFHSYMGNTVLPRLQQSVENSASTAFSPDAANNTSQSGSVASGGQAPAQPQGIAKMASTADQVQKALNDTKLNLPGAKTDFKFDPPKGLAEAKVTSPVVNTGVQYYAFGSGAIATTAGATPQQQQQSDRLSVNMNRPLLFSAAAHARYGANTSTLSYGVTQPIVGPLNANVDEFKHFNGASPNELIYHVDLGARF